AGTRRQPSANGAHLGLRLLVRDTRFEPPHGAGKTTAALARLLSDLPRRPHLGYLAGHRACLNVPVEVSRHHADYRGFGAVQDQFAPDDLPLAAETALP